MMKNIFYVQMIVISMFFRNTSCAQTTAADNKPSKSVSYHAIPTGPTVFGIFEGRPPCQLIAKQMDSPISTACDKVKWRLILFQDAATKEPTNYELLGRLLPSSGKWRVTQGIPDNPRAEVVELALGSTGKYFYLLKGDNNVLFVLDEHKSLRVGNDYFSYTLNRVELVAAK